MTCLDLIQLFLSLADKCYCINQQMLIILQFSITIVQFLMEQFGLLRHVVDKSDSVVAEQFNNGLEALT